MPTVCAQDKRRLQKHLSRAHSIQIAWLCFNSFSQAVLIRSLRTCDYFLLFVGEKSASCVVSRFAQFTTQSRPGFTSQIFPQSSFSFYSLPLQTVKYPRTHGIMITMTREIKKEREKKREKKPKNMMQRKRRKKLRKSKGSQKEPTYIIYTLYRALNIRTTPYDSAQTQTFRGHVLTWTWKERRNRA